MNQTHQQLAKIQAEQNADDKTQLGFWIYIMTDCVLFASLFAVYAVLHGNTADGPAGRDLFNLNYVLIETLILLTSSFTCGLSVLAAQRMDKQKVLTWLAVTFALGASFVAMEVHEFNDLASHGHSWHQSGFLSAYFTLVGTHGLHISIGLLWAAVLMFTIYKKGLGRNTLRKLTLFSLFWHFLDLIWIFIFTIVYLYGVIPL